VSYIVHDQNGADSYFGDWRWACLPEQREAVSSTGERVTSALALRIAADVLREKDPQFTGEVHAWTHRDMRLARAAIAGIRGQGGIVTKDSLILRDRDWMATNQLDVWIYG